jgi:4-amino-4-deoxychorismate lyase
MYPCIEAIEWLDGCVQRLAYHQQRIDAAFGCLYPELRSFDLAEELKIIRKAGGDERVAGGCFFPEQGHYKLRLEYDFQLRRLEFQEYRMREVQLLQLVPITLEPMLYKSSARELIDGAFNRRGECDDVLLVREGLLTDTSYANIALFDGRKWLSPRVPLLYGTRRAYLIDRGLIEPADIRVEDISRFQLIRMFNALIDFGVLELPVSAIRL